MQIMDAQPKTLLPGSTMRHTITKIKPMIESTNEDVPSQTAIENGA